MMLDASTTTTMTSISPPTVTSSMYVHYSIIVSDSRWLVGGYLCSYKSVNIQLCISKVILLMFLIRCIR